MSEYDLEPAAFDDTPWRMLWEEQTGRSAVAARPLAGGISAVTVQIDYVSPAGMLCHTIARKHGPIDLARDPRIAWHELALLQVVRDAGVPAPRGIGVSDAGFFPTPVLLIEHIAGSTEPSHPLHPEYAAELLAEIHGCPVDDRLAFLPRTTGAIPPHRGEVAYSRLERLIRTALAAAEPLETSETTLLHGDFWPGNLIWETDDHPTAIDWEDACLGDPLSDLANARLEWRLAYDARAAERLTRHYVLITGRPLNALSWWDLRAALRLHGLIGSFGLDPATERQWRAKLRRFVDDAIARLGAGRANTRGEETGQATDQYRHHE